MKNAATPLPPKGRRLLEAIVDYLANHKVDHTRPETYPTYEVMYRMVVPNVPRRILYVGHNLRTRGLDDLADWTIANPWLPQVTGIIVDKITMRPGNGFFPSQKRTEGKDDGWWHEEVRKSIAFDWSPFVGTQQASSPRLLADDLSTDGVPKRIREEVSRIVRDTKIAREVKALHDHTCQLCGHRLEIAPGHFYSEAHHVRPLGKPHNGPDKKSNVVCVCPNCHVKLDFMKMTIRPGALRSADGHIVAQEFIDYHNRCVGRSPTVGSPSQQVLDR